MSNIVDDSGNAFVVDRSMSETNKPRVLKFSFGDGYEQRIADGINTLGTTFSVSFKNRTTAEMNNLIDFFESKNGVTPFAFSPPGFSSGTVSSLTVSGNRISGGNSTLSGIIDDGWVIITGSDDNDGGYSVDSDAANPSNTTSAVTLYSPALTDDETGGTITVQKALGVVCEDWSVSYPQTNVVSVTAKFKRVYEP